MVVYIQMTMAMWSHPLLRRVTKGHPQGFSQRWLSYTGVQASASAGSEHWFHGLSTSATIPPNISSQYHQTFPHNVTKHLLTMSPNISSQYHQTFPHNTAPNISSQCHQTFPHNITNISFARNQPPYKVRVVFSKPVHTVRGRGGHASLVIVLARRALVGS